MKEIWKDIEGYEGLYQISNLGNVCSIKKNKNLKPQYRHKYLLFTLSKLGIAKQLVAHRLVAKAFLINDNNLPQVNHIDGNPENNNLKNLEWCDRSHNMKHSYAMGLHKGLKGEDCPTSYLTEIDILDIRKRRKRGESCISIGKLYKLNRNYVYAICTRRVWKHI